MADSRGRGKKSHEGRERRNWKGLFAGRAHQTRLRDGSRQPAGDRFHTAGRTETGSGSGGAAVSESKIRRKTLTAKFAKWVRKGRKELLPVEPNLLFRCGRGRSFLGFSALAPAFDDQVQHGNKEQVQD